MTFSRVSSSRTASLSTLPSPPPRRGNRNRRYNPIGANPRVQGVFKRAVWFNDQRLTNEIPNLKAGRFGEWERMVDENAETFNLSTCRFALTAVIKGVREEDLKAFLERNRRLIDRLYDRIKNTLNNNLGITPRTLSDVIYNSAKIGRYNLELCELIIKKTKEIIRDFKNPRDLGMMIWGLGKLELKDQDLFSLIAEKTIARIDDFPIVSIVQIAQGFSLAKVRHPQLFAAIGRTLVGTPERRGKMDELKPGELAFVLWSFAKSANEEKEVIEQLGKEAQRHIEKYDTKQLSLIAWSLGVARIKNPDLYQKIAIQMNEKESENEDPMTICQFLYGIQKSGLDLQRIHSIFAKYIRMIKRRMKEFDIYTLIKFAGSYRDVEFHDRVFYQEIWDEISPHLQKLSPAELYSIAVAFQIYYETDDKNDIYRDIARAAINKKAEFTIKQFILFGNIMANEGMDEPELYNAIEERTEDLSTIDTPLLILNLQSYFKVSLFKWDRIELLMKELSQRMQDIKEDELSRICHALALFHYADREGAFVSGIAYLEKFLKEMEQRQKPLDSGDISNLTITFQYLKLFTKSFNPASYPYLYPQIERALQNPIPKNSDASSKFQKDVYKLVREMLPPSVNIQKNASIQGYSVDHLIEDRLVLDVDGPYHTLASGRIPANYVLREAILIASGYRMRHVSRRRWEYEEGPGQKKHNEAYLRSLLPEYFAEPKQSNKRKSKG